LPQSCPWPPSLPSCRYPKSSTLNSLAALAAALQVPSGSREAHGSRAACYSALTSGNLTRGNLARGSLTRGSLARGSLTRGNLARGSLTRGSLARGSLTRGNLARGSLTRWNLARRSLAGGNLARGSLMLGVLTAADMALADECRVGRGALCRSPVLGGRELALTEQRQTQRRRRAQAPLLRNRRPQLYPVGRSISLDTIGRSVSVSVSVAYRDMCRVICRDAAKGPGPRRAVPPAIGAEACCATSNAGRACGPRFSCCNGMRHG